MTTIIKRLSAAILLGFLLLLLPGSILAQNTGVLRGTVRDSVGKPLFGVTVAVFGKPQGTTTRDDGRYELSLPANEALRIVFSSTGLRTDTVLVTLTPGESRVLDRRMRSRVVQFKEVNIEDRSLKTINVTPINPKVVSVLPTPNQSVEDLIKTMPGVGSANELSST